MAEKKKEVKVEDVGEFLKDLSGLVKESYLSSLELTLSLWEENQKFVNAQIEQFFKVQKEYADQLKSTLEKSLPKEVASFWNNGYSNGNLDRLASAQREYVNLVKNVSSKFTKDALNLTQKATERTFSAFEKNLTSLNRKID